MVSHAFGRLSEFLSRHPTAAQWCVTASGFEQSGVTLWIRNLIRSSMLLASNAAELQTAIEYFATRKASLLRFLDELTKLSKSAENRDRVAKLRALVDALDKGKDQLVAVRKQVLEIESKRGSNDVEAAAQLSRLAAEVARTRSEVTLPVSKEMETIANTISEHGNKRQSASGIQHARWV